MKTERPYLRALRWPNHAPPKIEMYPYGIPAIRALDQIEFHPDVTFFVGENGSGKSTLIEAIALGLGLSAEGGNKPTRFTHYSTRDTHSGLHQNINLVKSKKIPGDHFFLRAESFYNFATMMEGFRHQRDIGGRSLHAQSHGESFLSILTHKLAGNGLYIMDEPEAALSPVRQMTAITAIHQLVLQDSQFIIATHSPILLAYPNARIYEFSENGIQEMQYDETEQYRITKSFLDQHERLLEILMESEEEGEKG